MSGKKPWLKFYVDDWRAEPNLKLVGRPARSLWVDLMCLMHKAEPYGHLLIEGVKPSFADLSKILGDTEKEIFKLIGELTAKRVCSITEAGVLYSRRMVRDHLKAETDKANGKGGGNPTLVGEDNGGVNPPDKPADKAPDNGGLKAHMPEAIAKAKQETNTIVGQEPTSPPQGNLVRKPETFPTPADLREAVEHFNAVAREVGLPQVERLTDKRMRHLRARLQDLEGLGPWFGVVNSIRESPFLRGQKTDWRCDFDWLVNQSNFVKVIEGKYTGDRRAA